MFLQQASYTPSFGGLGLRSIAQATHRLGLVLASLPDGDSAIVQTLVVLFMMRTNDADSYHRFIRGEATDEEVVEAFFGSGGLSILRYRDQWKRVEALVIAAAQEGIRRRRDAGSAPLAAVEDYMPPLDQPLYERYRRLENDPMASQHDVVKREDALEILQWVRRFEGPTKAPDSGLGGEPLRFADAVARLELLSFDLKQEGSPVGE